MNSDNFMEETKAFRDKLNDEMVSKWNDPVEEELRVLEQAWAEVKSEAFKHKLPLIEEAKLDYEEKRADDEALPTWEDMLRSRYYRVEDIIVGAKVSRRSVLDCAILGQYVAENKDLYIGAAKSSHDEFHRMVEEEPAKKK